MVRFYFIIYDTIYNYLGLLVIIYLNNHIVKTSSHFSYLTIIHAFAVLYYLIKKLVLYFSFPTGFTLKTISSTYVATQTFVFYDIFRTHGRLSQGTVTWCLEPIFNLSTLMDLVHLSHHKLNIFYDNIYPFL